LDQEALVSIIKLERGTWTVDYDDPLGLPGGFGEVFRGSGPTQDVAVKRLRLTATAAAHREMTIGKTLLERTLNHVVPVLDYGQDSESEYYFLVMPICSHSLQQYISENGPLGWEDSKGAILDIILGLEEVNDIIHRDLKPSNVLWLNGNWRIADFGIAKFVEDSTSLRTLRDSLTPGYAAPEQWLGEPPTKATDVYALGCVIHALMNGEPPFGGSGDIELIRFGHLEKTPPSLNAAPARLNSIVQAMLKKSAASRPSLARCASVVTEIEDQPEVARFV
jgi:serine/threonine-protein kinase